MRGLVRFGAVVVLIGAAVTNAGCAGCSDGGGGGGDANHPVIALDDSGTTLEDTATDVDVAANDQDADGDPISVLSVTDGANGLTEILPSGVVRYTPIPGFNGSDSFTYQIGDGSEDVSTAGVTITVTPVNDAPIAVGNQYSIEEDGTLAVGAPGGVLGNDVDVEASALTAALVVDVTDGVLALATDGSFTYIPNADFNGQDTFTYRASDGALDSAPVVVTIDVGAVADAPVAAADDYAVDEDGTLAIAAGAGVLFNDTDADGDALTAELGADVTNGTLSLAANGSFTYTPDPDFNGSDSFTYLATDGALDSSTVTVTITVNAVNDAPVAAADAFSVTEDAVLTVAAPGVLANDTDADADALRALLVTGVSSGTLALSTNGSFVYTPDADFSGSDSFTYHANDGTADSGDVTVAITVNAAPDAPVALPDSYSVDEDATLAPGAGVLANDTDADGEALSAVLVADVTNGVLALATNGTFTYSPDADYDGPDSFTYQAFDGTLFSGTVTVSITVDPVADAPVGVAESHSVSEDGTLAPGTGVLANDTDADGDTLSAVLISNVTQGALTLATNGSFTYSPNANYNGPDSFTYQAIDGALSSGTVTVSITVDPVNDVPVAAADSFSTTEDTPLVEAAPGVLANDSDVEGPLLALLETDVANGTLALATNGSFTYTPDANYFGPDEFTYRASDGTANTAPITVTITVNPAADAPVGVADVYVTSGTLSAAAFEGVLANDTDADGDTLTAVLVSDVTDGTLTLGTDGSFVYEPDLGFNGVDGFTYQANDGGLSSAVTSVTITVSGNQAPVAVADSFSTSEDTPLVVGALAGVLANDTDADSDPLSALLVSDVSNGVLSLATDGSFTYTPGSNFNGSDSFTYQAFDGALSSGTVTVSITVDPVNDVPVAAADSFSTTEDTPLVEAASGVLANDSDVEGPLRALLETDVTNGTLTLATNGSFTYTPDANYSGPDEFTYRASDGIANTAPITVTLTVTASPDAPVGVSDSYPTVGTLSVAAFEGVLANDTDADGDTLTASLVTDVTDGTLTLGTDGSFVYVPDLGFEGVDSFTYQANDGALSSAATTVTITVGGNAAPVAVADSYPASEDTPLVVGALSGVLANDTDSDGDTLSAFLISNVSNGVLSLATDGSFTYTPSSNYNGPDSFSYQAWDGELFSSTVAVTLNVAAVNDAPVAADEGYSLTEDGFVTVAAPGVLANDTDVDSGSLTALLVTGVSNGTLSLSSNGSLTYTPDVNFQGTDSFTYSANDAAASSAPATVTFTVNAPTCNLTGSDALFGAQWHLVNTAQSGGTAGQDADVAGAWASCIRGDGVVIAVVDDGLEIGHEDLSPNVIAGASHNYVNDSTDPTGGAHGTSVAGVAAARDLNTVGVRGVAPRASLVGYNYLANGTSANEIDAMTRGSGLVDINTNSWGPADGTGELIDSTQLWRDAILQEVTSGRDGLGTVYTWAAGNGGQGGADNSNWDGYANFVFVNSVCAVNHFGTRAPYSEPGANLLVCGPSEQDFTGNAMTTTDRSGNAGYNTNSPTDLPDNNYTERFNGTSGATPVVAGAAALVIHENPTLTWRDVRMILAETARQNDPLDPDWVTNGAGYLVNHDYGFGTVDASAAVAAAHTWVNLGPLLPTETTDVILDGRAIPDDDTTGLSASTTFTGAITEIEFMEIYFRSDDHTYWGDLEIVIRNETTGTESILSTEHACSAGSCSIPAGGWFFNSTRHLGEDPNGMWTLTVRDLAPVDTGTFESWGINFYGR